MGPLGQRGARAAIFGLGLVIGALVAVGAGLTRRAEQPATDGARPAPARPRSPFADLPSQERYYTLSLNNPDTVAADEATYMRPDDLVVGTVVGNAARAYPWWILSNFHVVNDVVDRVPVYVGLCEVCTGAAAFRAVVPALPQTRLTFEHSGVHGGTFEITDLATLSQWHPFMGVARSGPLAGSRMSKIATFLERWDRWKALRPDTDVVLGSAHMRERQHGAHPGQNPGDAYMPGIFARTANFGDHRLGPHDLVYGLSSEDGSAHLAVPLGAIAVTGVMQLDVGRTPVLLFRRGSLRVHAYVRRATGEKLRFEVASEAPLRLRDQNGTVWDAWGRGLSGPDQGAALPAASGYVTEWYEWSTANPKVQIYRSPSRPGR